MKFLRFLFFNQVLSSSVAIVALLGAIGISSPARADVTLCPGAAGTNGSGTYSFTSVAGPLDSTCGVDSAVEIAIGDAQSYGRLAWFPGSTPDGYPAVTLSAFLGTDAQVLLDSAGDQPFYMLSFTDSTDGLGQTSASDQILMIEFQSSTVSGGSMDLDPNSTLFNLYDNTNGFYLGTGQSDTNTVAGWLAADPFLDNDSLDQIRIGIGLDGGAGPGQSVTVDSLGVFTSGTTESTSTPEPTSVLLLLTAVAATGLAARRGQPRNQRS
jgi:hypothetical protein